MSDQNHRGFALNARYGAMSAAQSLFRDSVDTGKFVMGVEISFAKSRKMFDRSQHARRPAAARNSSGVNRSLFGVGWKPLANS